MQFAPMVVNMLGFKINSMDRLSMVTFAPLQQFDIFESNKRNQGFGEQNGDLNAVPVPLNFVVDTDLLDASSQKTSVI